MAHILVYLERTPKGLHPASALALCVARDIASNRGASVTAVCPGDAGSLDAGIGRAAGRFGADVVMFLGPEGLTSMIDRLHPVHLLAPWTPEGLGAVQDLSLGPAIPRWIDRARPPGAGSDTVTGIVAGALPWHAMESSLDPEYLGEVDRVPLPEWVAGAMKVDEGEALGFSMVPEGGLHYVPPAPPGPEIGALLQRLGAEPIDPEHLSDLSDGALVWFCNGAGELPEALRQTPATVRSMVLTGSDGAFDPSWMYADVVVPGAFDKALARLAEPLWRAALA